MKTQIQLLFLLIIISSISMAQQITTGFLKLSGPYLGQKLPGMEPELFALGIVSTRNHEHSRLVISKDENEIYWIVIPVDTTYKNPHGGPFRTKDQNIFFTTKVNGEWTKPDILALTKLFTPNALALSPLNEFYFQAYDQETDPNESPRSTKLFVAEKNKNQWGNAKLTESIIPKAKGKTIMTFCFADNGNLYYDYGGPDETGEWTWNIYIREYHDGNYQEPKLLESGINDGKINWCPWISPDESYIIWSSHREGNYGSGDLYICFKNNEGSWSTPMNMGNKINTEGQERFPSVSPDGKYLFFARHKDRITYSDFYWVDSKVIEELERTALK